MSAASTVGQPQQLGSRANFIFVWIRRVWLVLTIAIGIAAAILLDDNANHDVDLVLIWTMMALCLPSSLLAVLAVAALSYLAQPWLAALPKQEGMFIGWSVFFLFGLLQWYLLLPRLLRKRVKQ